VYLGIAFTTTGPCVVSGMCISTPHYGHSNYDNNEVCDITFKQSGTLRFDGFVTEANYDKLTIDDAQYSGFTVPVGVVVKVSTSAKWVSDGINTNRGWKMCLVPQTPPGATPCSPIQDSLCYTTATTI